jgi:RNA polymerase sigma-70 factor (ECF subfamily)
MWEPSMSRRDPQRDAGTLYRALAPAVLGFLRAQRVTDPEDVLGEVFLQVARDIKKVPSDDLAARRWVFAVARNRAIDDARRRSRRPTVTTWVLPDLPAQQSEQPIDPSLLIALDRLTPDQREVVLLRFVADLPLDAVAKITRRPLGAVKALQHRALTQLAKAVSREVHETL